MYHGYGGVDTTATRTRAWYWNPTDRDWLIQVGLLVWAVAATTGFVYYAIENANGASTSTDASLRGGLSSLDLECIDHWVGLQMDEVVNGSVPRGSAIVRTSDGAIHATNDHPPEVQAISHRCMNLLHQTLRSSGRQIDTVSTPSADSTSAGRRLSKSTVTQNVCGASNCLIPCTELFAPPADGWTSQQDLPGFQFAYLPSKIADSMYQSFQSTLYKDTEDNKFLWVDSITFQNPFSGRYECATGKPPTPNFAVFETTRGTTKLLEASDDYGNAARFSLYELPSDNGDRFGWFKGFYLMPAFFSDSALTLPSRGPMSLHYGHILKLSDKEYVMSTDYIAYDSKGTGGIVSIGLPPCSGDYKPGASISDKGKLCRPNVLVDKCNSASETYHSAATGNDCIPTYTCPSGSTLYYLMNSYLWDMYGTLDHGETLDSFMKHGLLNNYMIVQASSAGGNTVPPIYACLEPGDVT